jgi:ABC-type lipoprotein release transport system permease subunit
MKVPFLSLLKIIMEGKSSIRFLLGAIGSFAFSIAVILCTVGLMDGFESTLVRSLQNSSGDLILTSRDGFFHSNEKFYELQKNKHIKHITPITQVEAFFIFKGNSKGVLVKGVEEKSFKQITNLDMSLKEGELVIGKALLESLGLKIGDEIVLTFASNSKSSQGSPILRSFVISAFVEHGVYEKDMRYVYLDRSKLLSTLNYTQDTANMALLKVNGPAKMDNLKSIAFDLQNKLTEKYKIQTFWDEFKTLLDAVEVEKFSITIVLQMIVVVAIFNVIAFIIFISEKKSQELFLLRALGLNLKNLIHFWYRLLIAVWAISSVLSIGLTYLFNYLLMNLPIFQLPGDIYVLSRLSIDLTAVDFVTVFGLALVWVLIIGFVSLIRLKNKTLLHGLRQEFS